MKNIGKINAIIISSIIALVMIFGVLLSFVPMHLGNKDYESFAGALSESTTINAGMSVEYTIKESGEEKDVKKSISLLKEIINDYGYKSATVYLKGTDKIRVDLNEPVLVSERSSTESFLSTLASGKLEFKNQNDASASLEVGEGETVDPTLIIIDASKHIDKISKIHYSQASGIKIDFNKEGKNLYSASVNQSLYMFVGNEAWPNSSNNQISANTDASATSMYLMFNSNDVVDSYYYTLCAGMMPIELDSENVEIVYNSSKSALTAKVAGIVLTFVFAVVLIVLSAIKQKGFSIASIVSSLIVLSLELFLLQAMNWVTFGLSSFVAMMVVMLVIYLLNATIYTAIKEELKIGKTLSTAVEDAYRKNMWFVIDTLVVMFIAGFGFACFSSGEMAGFGTILALASVMIALTTLLLNRLIQNCIYSLTEKATTFFGLTQGGQNNEDSSK